MLKQHVPCSQLGGQVRSVKGTAAEMLGNTIGSEEWSKWGRDEHNAGEADREAARARDYAEGAVDRASGKIDSVAGAVKGDKEQQLHGEST